MKEIESELASHRFLKGMDPEFIERLAECARTVEFETGQFILRQGEAAREFYLIRSGKVTIELFSSEGGPVVIQTLGEGDVLGWSWLIHPYQWRFDARALEAGEAIVLDTDTLKNAFVKFPQFGYEILQRFVCIIADRLEAERFKLVNLYGAHS